MKNSKWQLLEKKESIITQATIKDYYSENFYEINVNNIFNSSSFKEHVLCVGQVQSGKTKNIENILEYGVTNGYKLIIIFAGITKILHRQTSERLNRITSNFEKIKFIDNVKNFNVIDLDKNTTVILSILKWSNELKNMFDSIDFINWKYHKVMIIDDECDYASLNISLDKKNSKTYQLISDLYKRFYNVKLISFTGTPFANIMSSNSWNLNPDRIVNLINYKQYCGIKYFNENSDIFYKSIFSDKDTISEVKIMQSFLTWLVSTACALVKNENFKSEFLVNIENYNEDQELIMHYIQKSITTLYSYSKIYLTILTILREFHLPTISPEILYQKIKNIINKLIEDKAFVILNSENDARNFESGKYQFCVIVGGFMISRGLTFEYLTTELFLNIPINKIAIDTLLQRCRWFGNRTLNNHNMFLRIITNQSVIDALKKAEEYVNIFSPGVSTTNIEEIYLKISSLDKKNNDVESTNATKRR